MSNDLIASFAEAQKLAEDHGFNIVGYDFLKPGDVYIAVKTRDIFNIRKYEGEPNCDVGLILTKKWKPKPGEVVACWDTDPVGVVYGAYIDFVPHANNYNHRVLLVNRDGNRDSRFINIRPLNSTERGE